jgi:uncharacterized protein (DUF362 family)
MAAGQTGPANAAPDLPFKQYIPSVQKAGPKPLVGITRAASYDRVLVKQQLQILLDSIGGVADLARGKKVAVKVNLTGGVASGQVAGLPEIETFLTHPEVVRALLELLSEAGAAQVSIVEAAYEPESWSQFGYSTIYQDTGASIVDLTECAPYSSFTTLASSTSPFFYPSFTVNPILAEVDTLISVSKMKCHNIAGVTHSIKNLFGLVPYRFYHLSPDDKWRSEFHGDNPGMRVPGVILDLHSMRKVDLALIDGIKTMDGGEGPWNAGSGNALNPLSPGILIAGKDPVAADAVATACMGFDPTAGYPNAPFLHGINHLAMAAQRGMGVHNPAYIQVAGEAIAAVALPFQPSY